MSDLELPTSTLRDAVVAGLLFETQVMPMDRETVEALADRVMEGIELADLTVLDRSRVAAWLGVVDDEVKPLLRLHGRGTGICDVRGFHAMTVVEVPGWSCDVVVCEDCESATQVERDE